MSIVIICDECGKPAKGTFGTGTGRVIIDGKDNNLQAVHLCKKHWPVKSEWNKKDGTQPHNCKRVSFYWPPGVSVGQSLIINGKQSRIPH